VTTESDLLNTPPQSISKIGIWVGRFMSGLIILMLTGSAIAKFIQPPGMGENMTKLGYPIELMKGLGLVELVCVALYAIPRSAALGAILLTGYIGGIISSHLRVGESIIFPIILGLIVWGGLYLRDHTIRNVIPIKRS
jgi:hypothetical protein